MAGPTTALTEPGSPRPAMRPQVEAPSGLITADEVATLLGVPVSWVYERSRKGAIPTVTLGRYRRYRREAIERWLFALEAAGSESLSRSR